MLSLLQMPEQILVHNETPPPQTPKEIRKSTHNHHIQDKLTPSHVEQAPDKRIKQINTSSHETVAEMLCTEDSPHHLAPFQHNNAMHHYDVCTYSSIRIRISAEGQEKAHRFLCPPQLSPYYSYNNQRLNTIVFHTINVLSVD